MMSSDSEDSEEIHWDDAVDYEYVPQAQPPLEQEINDNANEMNSDDDIEENVGHDHDVDDDDEIQIVPGQGDVANIINPNLLNANELLNGLFNFGNQLIDDEYLDHSESDTESDEDYLIQDDDGENPPPQVEGEAQNQAENARRPSNNNNNNEQFDIQLPSRHEYLGNEMETLSGRSLLEEGQIYEIPLIVLGIHLVPGQTLPLSIFHTVFQNAIRRCVSNDKIFGIVNTGYVTDEGLEHAIGGPNINRGALGTIAEIFEFQEENDDVNNGGFSPRRWPSSFAIKAKGRERFNVLSIRRQGDGNLMGKVIIRPEIKSRSLLSIISSSFNSSKYIFPLPSISTNSSNSSPISPSSSSTTTTDPQVNCDNEESKNSAEIEEMIEKKRKWVKRQRNRYYSTLTPFPSFVYNEFDEDIISERILSKLKVDLKGMIESTQNLVIPKDPNELSYWLAQNLTLDDNIRSQILKMDTPIQRLRFEWKLLENVSRVIKCKRCENLIADYNEIFCMSIEGPTGTYVNPNGCIHETITVLKVKDIIMRGAASTEASWFPGYSWRIAECRRCRHHIGWKFKGVRPHLHPRKFFGLASKSINIKYDFNSNNDEEDANSKTTANQNQAEEAAEQIELSRVQQEQNNNSARRRSGNRLLSRLLRRNDV